MKLSEIVGALECFPEGTIRLVEAFGEKVRVEYHLNPLDHAEISPRCYVHQVDLSELRRATDPGALKKSIKDFLEYQLAKAKGVYP